MAIVKRSGANVASIGVSGSNEQRVIMFGGFGEEGSLIIDDLVIWNTSSRSWNIIYVISLRSHTWHSLSCSL
jgi:hypothetical protein